MNEEVSMQGVKRFLCLSSGLTLAVLVVMVVLVEILLHGRPPSPEDNLELFDALATGLWGTVGGFSLILVLLAVLYWRTISGCFKGLVSDAMERFIRSRVARISHFH
jgi:hypothetical protein